MVLFLAEATPSPLSCISYPLLWTQASLVFRKGNWLSIKQQNDDIGAQLQWGVGLEERARDQQETVNNYISVSQQRRHGWASLPFLTGPSCVACFFLWQLETDPPKLRMRMGRDPNRG